LDDQETRLPPRKTAKPEVERQVSGPNPISICVDNQLSTGGTVENQVVVNRAPDVVKEAL
jgi:hypothetical protein